MQLVPEVPQRVLEAIRISATALPIVRVSPAVPLWQARKAAAPAAPVPLLPQVAHQQVVLAQLKIVAATGAL